MLHEIQQIHEGFILAELTIVVAFIALLVVFVLPGLLSAHGRLQAFVVPGTPQFITGVDSQCSIAGNQASVPAIRRGFPADAQGMAGVAVAFASMDACGSPFRSAFGDHTTEPAI